MTIKSSRRLRLFMLSLSLFCFDVAVAQSTQPALVAQGSSPPDIEVLPNKWTMVVRKTGVSTEPAIISTTIQRSDRVNDPLAGLATQTSSSGDSPLGITIRNAKVETLWMTSPTGSVADAPDSTPKRLPLPTDGSAVKIERIELHAYSVELSNDGPKPVKALAWDFIFADPATGAEELRHSFANLQNIETGRKKTVRFTTQLSPPRIVDATALGKDPKATSRQYAQLQCVMFADGSMWERPNSKQPCERLQKWLELRKHTRPGLLQDLPFNP